MILYYNLSSKYILINFVVAYIGFILLFQILQAKLAVNNLKKMLPGNNFKKMFPDSKVADFTMSTSKVSYIGNHGLATYFKTLLKEEIIKFDCYIVSFDESLNDITQTCQMDLLVWYWDVNDKVKVIYWTSAFLVHSAASDLLTHF